MRDIIFCIAFAIILFPMKTLFTDQERKQASAITALIVVNPFSDRRIETEKSILGDKHFQHYDLWRNRQGLLYVNPNLKIIDELAEQLILRKRASWPQDPGAISPQELDLWDLLVIDWLFEKYRGSIRERLKTSSKEQIYDFYKDYLADFHHFLLEIPRPLPSNYSPGRIFAICHQMQIAFDSIFEFIAGGSSAAAQMRAEIWQSIFTCDLRRYYQQTYATMKNFTTLITGESGTGKELVARAIALSQFIPFDESKLCFQIPFQNCFLALQLSAMPQTILESELFGHRKGSFTGAIDDHVGYLEACPQCGSIFLDEIGDVSAEIQIKLLRVLQNRTFQRIGETNPREFNGKIIAATNRDLEDACERNTFRRDLLFRLCADTIQTAPLRQLLNHDGQELWHFVTVLAQRMLNGEEATRFAEESTQWITDNLGLDYPWPGNVRELEQCLRNILIRGRYLPLKKKQTPSPIQTLLEQNLPADEVLSQYLTALYQRENKNLAKTATIAQLDRRTVKRYISNN